MEYIDKDVFGHEKKTYVASESLDRKMELMILWIQIFSVAAAIMALVGLFGIYWMARNNIPSQLFSILKYYRSIGVVPVG